MGGDELLEAGDLEGRAVWLGVGRAADERAQPNNPPFR